MLSNSSCWSRNWKRSMSQATWPASAMIFISVIGAMRPFFCSSKSLVSANGKVAFACLQHLQRELRRRLALGVEMPLQGADLLRARGARIEDKVFRQGEGGCRSRNGHHELSSGCHLLTPPASLTT